MRVTKLLSSIGAFALKDGSGISCHATDRQSKSEQDDPKRLQQEQTHWGNLLSVWAWAALLLCGVAVVWALGRGMLCGPSVGPHWRANWVISQQQVLECQMIGTKPWRSMNLAINVGGNQTQTHCHPPPNLAAPSRPETKDEPSRSGSLKLIPPLLANLIENEKNKMIFLNRSHFSARMSSTLLVA